MSKVTQQVGGRVRPKPGVSPDSWLGALSRGSPSFLVVSLAASRAAHAHGRALLHACQVDAGTARMENGFLAMFKPGHGAGGNVHSGQKHGLWGHMDLGPMLGRPCSRNGPLGNSGVLRASVSSSVNQIMRASLFHDCRALKRLS